MFNDPLVLPVISGVTATLAIVLGLVLGRRGQARLREEAQAARAKLARSELQAREQGRLVARLQGEQGTVATLALSLPSVVRELNRGDLQPRAVPPLILNLAEAIFQPGYMLLYLARPMSGDPDGRQVLQLVSQQGYGEIPEALRTIPFDEGKIGWIAENRLDMLREDWLNVARIEGASIEENHAVARLDIAGPLMHHHTTGEQVLGVLCIGAPGTRPKNEKLMFQLVTNLASLALVNAKHVATLKDLANTDGLTELLNKRYFMYQLANLVIAAERDPQPLSLFIFDIDHFKNYNDTNGHLEGDRVLRQLAALLKLQVRPADRCCRYGGEEFIVAMPDTDATSAMVVAERIRKAIEEFSFENEEKQPGGRLTISGGVATFPADGANGLELTKNADRALYASKNGGRNQVRQYRGVQIGSHEDETDIDLAMQPVTEIDLD